MRLRVNEIHRFTVKGYDRFINERKIEDRWPIPMCTRYARIRLLRGGEACITMDMLKL